MHYARSYFGSNGACPPGTLAVKRSGGLTSYEMVEKD